VYLALPGSIDDMNYKDITSNIRSEQYIESINKFLTTLELQVGLSTGTFTFDGRSVKTATQIVSENSMTYRTRNSHISNIEQFIQELIISTCELARETYNVYGVPLYSGNIPTKEDITVNFDDGIFTDKNSELSFWAMAKQAGLAPTEEAIKRVHKLTDDDAADWAKKIKQEQSYEDPYEIQKRAESTLLGDYKE
jgi:A118 family predicted phage portal protein